MQTTPEEPDSTDGEAGEDDGDGEDETGSIPARDDEHVRLVRVRCARGTRNRVFFDLDPRQPGGAFTLSKGEVKEAVLTHRVWGWLYRDGALEITTEPLTTRPQMADLIDTIIDQSTVNWAVNDRTPVAARPFMGGPASAE